MTREDRNKAIEIMKTGNFSLIYMDQGESWLYAQPNLRIGNFNEFPEEDIQPVFKIEGNADGYTPLVVELLTEALNGSHDSV